MKKIISLIALAGVCVAPVGFAAGAEATNRGKHIVGGFGRHHRGGHMVGHQTNKGMHIVGGYGRHHKGGHMVR